MESSTDDEKIAPVSYLFGAPPDSGSTPAAFSSAVEDRSARGVDRAKRRAENVSLNGLTRRNMSRWEIEKLLSSRDLPEEVIATEVGRLERVGLIDDAALAETLVRTRRERKGLGRQALIAELRRRHIDQDIIDTALEAEDGDGEAEQERANELALKKARALSSYDQDTAKRRLTGFLMRKGYSSSVVQEAIAVALGRPSSGVQFR
ncbi:MAG TPA: regulatory protein RecX [Homoserinimonas sp.]|nr:regulatory protein RecX [Homoserinimonas sp.]